MSVCVCVVYATFWQLLGGRATLWVNVFVSVHLKALLILPGQKKLLSEQDYGIKYCMLLVGIVGMAGTVASLLGCVWNLRRCLHADMCCDISLCLLFTCEREHTVAAFGYEVRCIFRSFGCKTIPNP